MQAHPMPSSQDGRGLQSPARIVLRPIGRWAKAASAFDAPATGSLPAISVPGYLVYVSPNQVNVQVPANISIGNWVPVWMNFNRNASNTVTIAVQ